MRICGDMYGVQGGAAKAAGSRAISAASLPTLLLDGIVLDRILGRLLLLIGP